MGIEKEKEVQKFEDWVLRAFAKLQIELKKNPKMTSEEAIEFIKREHPNYEQQRK